MGFRERGSNTKGTLTAAVRYDNSKVIHQNFLVWAKGVTRSDALTLSAKTLMLSAKHTGG
jgi:hypothetical protein